jgi:hypothetical protein
MFHSHVRLLDGNRQQNDQNGGVFLLRRIGLESVQ